MRRTAKTALVLAALVAPALGWIACQGQNTVTFGIVLPLTGQWDIYGEPIKKGIELAYEEFEAGEPTLTVVLDVRDSQSRPQTAADELSAAYDAGALAAIGGVTTPEALAMVPVMDEHDRVLVSPSASSPRLTGISSNFYRVYPSDFREGSKMGNFAAQTLGVNKVVIIGAESPYAMGIQDVFKSEFERYGGEVAAVIEYPVGHTDFDDDVAQVLDHDPEAVYVADYAYEIGTIVKKLRDRGFAGRILTTHAFAAPGVFSEVGDAAQGVLLTRTLFDVDSDNPAVKSFVDAYRTRYGEDPDAFAAHGYDGFKVLLMAAQGGGITPRDFWKGMRSVKFEGASGQIQFDEKGDVGQFPRVYAIQDGQMVDYEKVVDEKKKEILERLEELKRQQREAARAARAAGN
jgi:branched-chain amino acid transport system substrate-binding protein